MKEELRLQEPSRKGDRKIRKRKGKNIKEGERRGLQDTDLWGSCSMKDR